MTTRKTLLYIAFFLVGLASTFLIQFSFKYQLSTYPILITLIIYFLIGWYSSRLFTHRGNPYLLYFLSGIVLILIQIYGLKINFKGLHILSPTIISISLLSYYVGYRASKSVITNYKSILCLCLFVVTLVSYVIPKITFKEKLNEVNKKLPDNWKLIDKGGNIFTKREIKKRITVISFWDSRCGYCFEMMPYMEKLKYTLDSNKVHFIEVNTGRIDSYDGFVDIIKKHDILQKLNPYYDIQSTFSKQLKVKGLPHYFIVDSNQRVLYDHVGFYKDEGLSFVRENKFLIEKHLN